MRIGLIDEDGHNFPNLPLMKLSAWHKQRGDGVEWYTPLGSGHVDIVYTSKVFSFSEGVNYPIYADEIVKGGSGYAIKIENGKEVYDAEADKPLDEEVEHMTPDYSIYPTLTKDTAFGFLTRGCPRGCDFCHVAAKEGKRSHKVADLSEFWNGQKNIVLCDPNILACADHMQLLEQLKQSKARVEFNQGLDVRLMNEDNLRMLSEIKIKRIHLAFDRWQDKDIVEPRLWLYTERMRTDRNNTVVYILINFDTTLEQDLYRVQLCRELGVSPFIMIYDKEHCDMIHRQLQRWCNPAIFWKVPTFDEYLDGVMNRKQETGQISMTL